MRINLAYNLLYIHIESLINQLKVTNYASYL